MKELCIFDSKTNYLISPKGEVYNLKTKRFLKG